MTRPIKGITVVRILRGISQWDLGLKTGIRNYHLSHIEHGRHKPTKKELEAIACALDVPLKTIRANDTKLLEALTGVEP